MTKRPFIGACLALLVVSPLVFAQGSQRSERTEEDLQRERDVLRARLEERLEQIREIEAQIESAMDKLDEGATPEEVVFSFRPGVFDLAPRGRDAGPGGPPRDDMPEGRPPRDQPPPNPLDTPERAVEFMDAHLPDLAAWVADFRERNPEMAERFMERLMRQLGPIAALERTDPELFVLRLEEYRIGYEILKHHREYRDIAQDQGADDPMAVELRSTLAAALEKRFDVKLEVLRHEIETVEGRVGAMRDELMEMETTRSQTIARQLEYFTDLSERRRFRRGDSRLDKDNDRRRRGGG